MVFTKPLTKSHEMRFPLSGRAYQERSLIASSMETINLYAELNNDDAQAPAPVTYYQTPGFDQFAVPAAAAKARCTYRSSLGSAYIVIGPTVYNLSINGALIVVGTIPDTPSQVYMADNGLAVVVVNGTAGWAIDIATNEFGPIIDPSFYGADFVLFLQTFFVFNRPKTNQFYISLSQVSYGQLVGTAIGTGNITAGGAAYVSAVYNDVPLTGGTGTGARAAITVTAGVVTAVDITNSGQGYTVGDVLSADAANLGGAGAGFQYTIASFALAFDPLDIAAKSGSADPIVALLTVHQELILVGALTTEFWVGTGAADFFFQQVQGAYLDHGCIAPYSASNQDVLSFWLAENRQGNNIVIRCTGYDIKEISTPFLLKEFASYPTTSDAIGFCFQINDHAFYALIFPQANKSWLYDLKSGQWSRWCYFNTIDGSLNRHRANCCMFVYNKVLIGDWETGNIYRLDGTLDTDNGNDIVRIKTFAHIVENYDRITYKAFDADIEVGVADDDTDPEILLSWSDDRGKSFGNPVVQSAGKQGEYKTTVSWNRLGYARDRIFKLQWTDNIPALNGGFIEIQKART